MINKLSLITFILLIALYSKGQGFQQLLTAVEKNNKSIEANKKYWDARKAEYQTGLTPSDPQAEFDYLFGSPAGAGNQKDISLTQRMDFPSTYKRKKELSNQQVAQTALQQEVYRQEILLETKLLALELIYLNKKSSELNKRLASTQQLASDYQKKLDKGDVIILDVNKARLQLLSIASQVALNKNEITLVTTKLAALNGGIEFPVYDTVYPSPPFIPDFQTLDSIIEANDPVLKVYEQEKSILQKQIAVQKALNLPKLEAGYHSQGILGQSYKGFHAGVSIPLWENKNKLKVVQAQLDYASTYALSQVNEHRFENLGLYTQLETRRTALVEYKSLLDSLNNTVLLNKALKLGQITIIQFFQDESYYFSAYDKYLQLELEYHQALARLFKYTL